MRTGMNLTKSEHYIIRLHKMLARLLSVIERIMLTWKNIFYLFSRKAKAVKLMKTGEIFEVQARQTAIEYFEKAEKISKVTVIHLNEADRISDFFLKSKRPWNGILQRKPDAGGNLYMGSHSLL
jgi:hypothetical protein